MLKLKNVLYFTASSLLIASLIGCSGTNHSTENKDVIQCVQDGVNAPSWVCKPSVKDGYAGLGVAEKNEAGLAQMKKVAYANGYYALVQQMQLQAKEKLQNFTLDNDVSSKGTLEVLLASVAKKIDLNPSKEIATWTSPSGKIYWLVTIPKSNFDEDLKKAVKLSYFNDTMAWRQFQSYQAQKSLEKEFAVKIVQDIKVVTGAETPLGFQVEVVDNAQMTMRKR